MELLAAQQAAGNFVCVGLDSDTAKLPEHLLRASKPHAAQEVFNRAIIDATCDFAGAYKPNLAFYPGKKGKEVLRRTIVYVHKVAPDKPVILDPKQGDIGNTNDGYVADDFDYYGADAVTVHNYMGMEAMRPFLDQTDKGVIVLCRTSNPGAGEFQDVPCEPIKVRNTGKLYSTVKELMREEGLEEQSDHELETVRMPLYQFVAHRVAQSWNYNGNCCMVVGATTPEELAEVRKIDGVIAILLPGIGAQGGPLEATIEAGHNSLGQGMIINNSRGIIFAYLKDEEFGAGQFGEAARKAGLAMHNAIRAQLGLSLFES